jgi:hypothetical protein
MSQTPPAQEPRVPHRNWDATKTEAPAELLQSGFEFAYFLIPDRSLAREILIRALEKLRVLSRREMKRLYWRDKHAESPVRRIARPDVDILQWLIMFESEKDERTQEHAGNPSPRNMVIRYIKHLVQTTTALSSFYVNVGISRLLHNYTTSEAQRVYEMLTSRYLGPDEYRRAKSILMDKTSERFGGFLKIARVERGELRFETSDNQEQWIELVTHCLRIFAPWSTQGYCAHFVVANGDTRLKSAQKTADTDQNESELKCCHILIEPTCYDRLMEDLAFDAPETRLALPRFIMREQQKGDDSNSQPPRAPELSQEDVDHIQQQLRMTDARRRKMNLRIVTIVVDGVEYTRLDLTQESQMQIGLETGASLIEVRGQDESGEIVLATHAISYANNAFESARALTRVSGGELKFEITPVAAPGQEQTRAILSLNYYPRLEWTRPWTIWRELSLSGRKISAYALSALVMAGISWGIAAAFYSARVKALEKELQQAQSNQQHLFPTAARAIVSYTLTPDDLRVRGTETAGIPEISLRLHSPAISLDLALPPAAQAPSFTAELKTFTGNKTLMTQNFLQPARIDSGPAVEIVVPADLLRADSYYTVYLHSPDRTDHFTFKIVDNQ